MRGRQQARDRDRRAGRRAAGLLAARPAHRQEAPQRHRRLHANHRDRARGPLLQPVAAIGRLQGGRGSLPRQAPRQIQRIVTLQGPMKGNKMKIARLKWATVFGATVALTAALGGAADAQQYPTRTITVVIPFAGGSASDVVSRIMLDKMSKNMGQAIVVENRPGAGGNSGTLQGARSTPDGYTLIGGGSGPGAANLTLYKSLGYDPEKALEVISPFAGFTIVVAASKALPVKSLKELIDYAKAHPGLNFGSVGIGSSQHLSGEYFRSEEHTSELQSRLHLVC